MQSDTYLRAGYKNYTIIHAIILVVKKYFQMVCWLCITSNSHPAKWCAWWNTGAIQYAANIYGRDAQTYCQGAEGAAYCFIIRGAQVARTESVGVLLLLRAPNPSQSQSTARRTCSTVIQRQRQRQRQWDDKNNSQVLPTVSRNPINPFDPAQLPQVNKKVNQI